MQEMMGDSFHSIMPVRLGMPKSSNFYLVLELTPMLEITGTTLRCMKLPSKEKLMFV